MAHCGVNERMKFVTSLMSLIVQIADTVKLGVKRKNKFVLTLILLFAQYISPEIHAEKYEKRASCQFGELKQ